MASLVPGELFPLSPPLKLPQSFQPYLGEFPFSKNSTLYPKTLFCFVFLSFVIFRAAPAAHGGSQARGLIRAIAAGLLQSHSNSGSKPHLRPTPEPQQLGIQTTSAAYTTAHGNARSLTHCTRPGIKPATSWFLVRFVSTIHGQEFLKDTDFTSRSIPPSPSGTFPKCK